MEDINIHVHVATVKAIGSGGCFVALPCVMFGRRVVGHQHCCILLFRDNNSCGHVASKVSDICDRVCVVPFNKQNIRNVSATSFYSLPLLDDDTAVVFKTWIIFPGRVVHHTVHKCSSGASGCASMQHMSQLESVDA